MGEQSSRSELIISLEVGAAAAGQLDGIMAATPVASVIFSGAGGAMLTAPLLSGLVAAAQRKGVTALVYEDARLARTLKADGVHISVSDNAVGRLEEARAVLGGRGVIGADAGRSRHDAMSLGEIGADYVAFGIPAFVKDRETAFDRQLDLVSWWAEIFEVPCVAMDVATAEQAGELTAAGADFVALSIGAGMTIAEAVDLAKAWCAAMANGPAATPGERGS